MVVGEVICSTAQGVKTLQKKYLWQPDVKMQHNNIKKHVFSFLRDLVGNVEKKPMIYTGNNLKR